MESRVRDVKIEEGYLTCQDGVQLFFRRLGQGKQIVIIPNGFYYFTDFQRFADSHTLIFYDVRNRGNSETVTDPSKLSRGIFQDADDLESVRDHFGTEQIALLGHSYIGLMIAMYSVRHANRVTRLVQMCATPPHAEKQYPDHLTVKDTLLAETFARLAQMQKQRSPENDPVENCKTFWSVLRTIYVANGENAGKIDWGRCELANERNFMKYWMEHLFPSLRTVRFATEDFALVRSPVLVIHGARDRSAPYGGGREWAVSWPNARLLTLRDAAHAPWIEAPDVVLESIRSFLDGNWPDASEQIKSI